MRTKSPSIIFPDMQVHSSGSNMLSRHEIRSLCKLKPLSSLAKSMGNYCVQKYKTKQLKQQYDAIEEAVDAEYTALEEQAYNHFQELTERLDAEFKAKQKQLKLELQRAEHEASMKNQLNNIKFDQYLKISTIYRKIFNILVDTAKDIGKLLEIARKEDIAVNTIYYVQLSEKYRELMRGIERYHKNIQ